MEKKKIGVLLSGCGVYDGAEIQEAVLTLLEIDQMGAEAVCIALNENQFHTINHLTGETMPEDRNMLVEAARIARGNIQDISSIIPADLDALVLPGGFGNAKNITNWAFEGATGSIHPKIKLLIVNMVNIGKPIVAFCVSPIVVAKALEDSNLHPILTIGSSEQASPYSIEDFSKGLKQTGASTNMKTTHEIEFDANLNIISAPCYMQEVSIKTIHENIQLAFEQLKTVI
jgi:enhancing lycopene biosynthesis protein 2